MENNISILLEGLKSNTIKNIKLLGDSITHGVGGTGFEQNGEPIVEGFRRNPNGFCWAKLFKDYLKEKYNCSVTNNACTGTDLDFVINNFNVLVNDKDDFIICTIGTNNRHVYKWAEEKKTPEELGKRVYQKILKLNELLKNTGKGYILIANIPASAENEMDGEDFWRVLHMCDINAIYKKAQQKAGFKFISMFDLFTNYIEKNQIGLNTLLCDGLHPNNDGFKVMFNLLTKALNV